LLLVAVVVQVLTVVGVVLVVIKQELLRLHLEQHTP
jgi:hypothetical protein